MISNGYLSAELVMMVICNFRPGLFQKVAFLSNLKRPVKREDDLRNAEAAVTQFSRRTSMP